MGRFTSGCVIFFECVSLNRLFSSPPFLYLFSLFSGFAVPFAVSYFLPSSFSSLFVLTKFCGKGCQQNVKALENQSL